MLLFNRKTEGDALDLLNAVYLHLPIELYQQHFKDLLMVLLRRVHSSKSSFFRKCFVINCCLFCHHQKALTFATVLNEIQSGMIPALLTQIWLPIFKTSLKHDERKVCTLGLMKLMSHDSIKQNGELLSGCYSSIVSMLGLGPSTALSVVEEPSDCEDTHDGAFEVSFNKLRNTDLPNLSASLAPDIPDLHAAAKAGLSPMKPNIMQLAQAHSELNPLLLFLQ